MAEAPHAPWAMRGEVIVAVVGRASGDAAAATGRATRLPPGVRALPGPTVVLGVRYTDSPVGPYVELSVAEPARLGLRPGLCLTSMVVSEAAAKVGNRLNWGAPAELGSLRWSADGDERVLRWEDGGVELRAVCHGPLLPALVPMRSVQGRGDGPVLVPRRLAGLLRFARVSVAASDGTYESLRGSHQGAVLSAARLLVRPARHPSGLLLSFRAPLRPAEPRLSYRSKATAEALE